MRIIICIKMGTQRLNITISSEIAEEFKNKIKPGKRSEFIANAILFTLKLEEKKRINNLLEEGYTKRNEDDKILISEFEKTISDGLDE